MNTRFIGAVVCVTLAGLLYVYTAVEAVQISYTIRRQEDLKTMGSDRQRALKYNIARLKAPHVLEKKLEAQRIVLTSPRSWQTLTLASSSNRNAPGVFSPSLGRPPLLSKFFVGTAQAEAKD